jgi:hypothetical protein
MKRILPLIILSFALAIPMAVHADDDAAAAPASTKKSSKPEPVENRITELHTKLKITQEQEDLWKPVAQQMRDSATEMKQKAGDREDSSATMTAIDDLKSYSEIASAHADGMRKFIDVFTPLYNSMTDDQKKNADDVFKGHKMAKRGKGKKS